MKLMKPTAIATGIGAVAGGLMGPMSQPASADSSIISSGGSADCQGQWLSAPDDFRIKDLETDGNYCYVHYGRNDDEVQDGRFRIENHHGGDDQWYRYNADVKGWSNIRFRVCENVGGGPDSCSNITGPWSL